MHHIFIVLLTVFFPMANAQVASMKINSDLVIHPSQVANVFMLTADKINKSATWDWPEMQFQKPYKTMWTQVQAKGPFSLNVHTEKLNSQELSFELYWSDPLVNVGQFIIHDTIVKNIGGVQIIINLDGSCAGMDWKAAGGLWKVRGKLTWGIVNQEIVVQWKEFEFTGSPTAPPATTNIGQCQGPPEIQQALKDNVKAVTGDQNAMQDLLRRGILAWMNTSLHGLKTELMKVRQNTLKPGLNMTWEPQFMITMPGGGIRIPGYLNLKRQGVSTMPSVVDRTLPEQDYATATESGFILPKNALENLAAFTYATGDLTRRMKSTEIKGFVDLMNNRTNQSIVWPDLQKFSTSTLFYFDISADSIPQLSNVRLGTAQNGGGIVYDAKSAVLINDLAPAKDQYLNYVDFRSTVSGLFRASVKSQQLVMNMSTSSVPLTAKFRSEYKSYRTVNENIDTSRLGTAGRDMINGKTFSVPLPEWNMTNMKAVYGDLKLFKQSILLPITFQKK